MNKSNYLKPKSYFVFLIVLLLIFVPLRVKISANCSWKLLNTPPNMSLAYSIAVDPNNSNIVYLGTGGKIYKSTDGGNNWAALDVGSGFINGFTIVFHPLNSKILYVGGSGMYKSTDSGKSWARIGYRLSEVTKIVINPVEPEKMYAIAGGLLYESYDGGETWTSDPSLIFYSFYDIILDPRNPDTLYAATNTGLLKRTITNHIINWNVINNGSSTKCIAVDPQNPDILYAGTYAGFYKGIYKSTNGGKDWFEADNGISFSNVNKMTDMIVIDPNNTNILYSLVNGVGLYKSTNGGSSWTFIQDEIATNIYITSITIDPSNSDTIYIGAVNQQNGKAVIYKHQCNVNYSLELDVVGQGNVLKNPDKDKYQENENVKLTAYPSTGYHFVKWSGDIPQGSETNNPITITMDSDKTITAHFAINPYTTITASAGTGGSISPSGTIMVNQGESKTFTITPQEGYRIKDVKVDGVSVGAVSTYTFLNVNSNHNIESFFEKNQQNIIVKVQIGSKVMTVNGQVAQLNVAPEIKEDHTYLPLRAIAEALGAKVTWIPETKGITVTLGDNTVGLQIGNGSAVVNGNVKSIFPPYLKPYGDRTFAATMVPLRVIAEGLGAQVNWDGATRVVTITLTKTVNQLPTASFTMNPTSGTAPLEVTFDASGSYDQDGNIVSYIWNFGDGNSGSGETVKHTFSSPGSYNVKLTVTDNEGATSSTIKTITLTKAITFCKIGVPYIADDGLTVTLNSLIITEKTGSYRYTINYTLTNNTDKAIEEGTFKMYYKDSNGGLPQYGFFGKLFPGDTKNRTYTFEELKSKPFDVLEYASNNFFSPEPLVNSLKWEVHIP